MAEDEAGITVTVSGDFGEVTVPLSEEDWDDAMGDLAQDEGWDVAICKIRVSPQITEPTIVGVVVRVPDVADPEEAAHQAVDLAAGVLAPAEGEFSDLVRIHVCGIDEFGEE